MKTKYLWFLLIVPAIFILLWAYQAYLTGKFLVCPSGYHVEQHYDIKFSPYCHPDGVPVVE